MREVSQLVPLFGMHSKCHDIRSGGPAKMWHPASGRWPVAGGRWQVARGQRPVACCRRASAGLIPAAGRLVAIGGTWMLRVRPGSVVRRRQRCLCWIYGLEAIVRECRGEEGKHSGPGRRGMRFRLRCRAKSGESEAGYSYGAGIQTPRVTEVSDTFSLGSIIVWGNRRNGTGRVSGSKAGGH
jgi:hypothetical protein